MTRACVGLLLAAGQSRRFGGDKLLHPLDDGTPMVLASARPLHAVLSGTVAVVDDADGEVARLLGQEGLQVVCNPQARKGVGASIACGVAASPDAGGWVIALGDMPWIPETVVQAVTAALESGADIVAPVYHGQRGHPVGFSARHATALMQLNGDEGARGIIIAHRDSLELIAVHDRGVLVDIDSHHALCGHEV
jgi:molybdenum cofactor cytidylyltransferase